MSIENSYLKNKDTPSGENSSVKIKDISSSVKNTKSFKNKEERIRLDKLHSESYRNKHFANCLNLLYVIDVLTSIKIYNYKQGKKGEEITLGELMEFLQAPLEEVHKKLWDIYFKAVILKRELEDIRFPKDERTIINYLNWLVFVGYLDKFKKEGFGSDKVFYKMNDPNTTFNNFSSNEFITRLTEDQRKKFELIPYFPVKLDELTLTEEDRRHWERLKQFEKDSEEGVSREDLKKKYGDIVQFEG